MALFFFRESRKEKMANNRLMYFPFLTFLLFVVLAVVVGSREQFTSSLPTVLTRLVHQRCARRSAGRQHSTVDAHHDPATTAHHGSGSGRRRFRRHDSQRRHWLQKSKQDEREKKSWTSKRERKKTNLIESNAIYQRIYLFIYCDVNSSYGRRAKWRTNGCAIDCGPRTKSWPNARISWTTPFKW